MRGGLALSIVVALAVTLLSAPTDYRIAECSAAIRNEPTLDAARAPGATFKVAPEPFMWPGDAYLMVGTETATLKSGARLQVTLAGCEAYSNRYRFEVTDRHSVMDSGYWLEKAAELMTEVESISSEVPVDFPAVRRDLYALADQAPKHDFKAGPLRVREGGLLKPNYEITLEPSDNGMVVTVDYWVPL